MKKILCIAFGIILISGCSKKENPIPEVTFTLNINGFSISTAKFGDLKSTDVFSSFTHTYPAMVLNFSTANGLVYTFNSGSTPITEFQITLPVGEYVVSGSTNAVAWSGNDWMALAINSQSVIIKESTTQIDISVTPLCTLVLVADENSLLDKSYIDSESTPLYIQGIFRYSYFHPSKVIYIVRKDGAQLAMESSSWKMGEVYKIEVTNTGIKNSINFNPLFTDADTLIW